MTRNISIFGTVFLLWSCLVAFFVSTPSAAFNPVISNAVILDFALTIPLIYFFLIRKGSIPKTTVLPVFILGLVIASLILPKEQQGSLDFIKKWIAPLIELAILVYISTRVYSIRKAFKAHSDQFDFYSTLKQSIAEILPGKVSIFLATELATFYYGLLHWKTVKPDENQFTYHKNLGTPALMFAFVGLIAIETVAFHLLLIRWNMAAAWFLTTLSVYSGIQILGFAKSLSKRPAYIGYEKLFLPYGIMAEATIDYHQISSVETIKGSEELAGDTLPLSPLSVTENPNLLIHLNETIVFRSFYGSKKECRSLAVSIDQKEQFIEKLQTKIG